MSTSIPPMTHPLSRHWDQPRVSDILLDDKHALMTKRVFEALHNYSATVPTGVYEGKMWRRHDGIYDNRYSGARPDPSACPWLLCWYGVSDKPDQCSINYRTIILVD